MSNIDVGEVNTKDWIATKSFVDETTKKRFFNYVDKMQPGECWNWIGHIMSNGYGEFWYNETYLAHRMSYLIFFGDYPDFALVLHKCDNKGCINPHHLYLGSHSQNLMDRYNRYPETKVRLRGRKLQ